MTTTLGQGHGRNRNVLLIVTAAAFLAAVLFASTAPAHARDHGHKNQGRTPRAARVAPYHAVPQVLTPEYRGAFKPYYGGRVYHAPHRHYHRSYRLPVWYGGVVAYRPYAYCGDHLFVAGAVTLPQLALAFTFGSPGAGFYFGGYYPAPPPAPYYVYEESHHHDGWND